MMTGGALGVAVATALMTTVGPGTSLWWMRALMLLQGLCWAQALVPLQACAFATIAPADTGAASTVFNTGRQLGTAVGVAILTTVASAVGPHQTGPPGRDAPAPDRLRRRADHRQLLRADRGRRCAVRRPRRHPTMRSAPPPATTAAAARPQFGLALSRAATGPASVRTPPAGLPGQYSVPGARR